MIKYSRFHYLRYSTFKFYSYCYSVSEKKYQ